MAMKKKKLYPEKNSYPPLKKKVSKYLRTSHITLFVKNESPP